MGQRRSPVGRVTKQCEHCGVDVTRKHSAFRDHVFCSRICYLGSTYNAERIVPARAESKSVRPCDHCGTGIERFVSQFAGSRTFCSVACRRLAARQRAHRQINAGGYVLMFVGVGSLGADAQGQILEHRKVMQDFLGRPLTAAENVHHRNGDKQDNRLANLELWSTSQPKGQRVQDKLAWAREFIAAYEGSPLV